MPSKKLDKNIIVQLYTRHPVCPHVSQIIITIFFPKKSYTIIVSKAIGYFILPCDFQEAPKNRQRMPHSFFLNWIEGFKLVFVEIILSDALVMLLHVFYIYSVFLFVKKGYKNAKLKHKNNIFSTIQAINQKSIRTHCCLDWVQLPFKITEKGKINKKLTFGFIFCRFYPLSSFFRAFNPVYLSPKRKIDPGTSTACRKRSKTKLLRVVDLPIE